MQATYTTEFKKVEFTEESVEALWQACRRAFLYDGPFVIQIRKDEDEKAAELLRARGFEVYRSPV